MLDAPRTVERFAAWFHEHYDQTAPATRVRQLAILRSACAFWRRQAWISTDPTAGLERPKVPVDRTRALTRDQLASLWRRNDVLLRERALWRLLYETAARANEILALDVDDLDLPNKRARVTSKGGTTEWVFWQTGAALLLTRLLAGRTIGPVSRSSPVASICCAGASRQARLEVVDYVKRRVFKLASHAGIESGSAGLTCCECRSTLWTCGHFHQPSRTSRCVAASVGTSTMPCPRV
jgi:integrase